MSGHLGTTKTRNRILQRYYWPGVFKATVGPVKFANTVVENGLLELQ